MSGLEVYPPFRSLYSQKKTDFKDSILFIHKVLMYSLKEMRIHFLSEYFSTFVKLWFLIDKGAWGK